MEIEDHMAVPQGTSATRPTSGQHATAYPPGPECTTIATAPSTKEAGSSVVTAQGIDC